LVMEKATPPVKKLEFLSSGSKVGVQLMWLLALVILPRLFPNLIELRYQTSLAINIFLALTTSFFYEILKFIYQKQGKNIDWILRAQLLTSVILLTWFLHVFGRINGPFFILYLLTIMESALNLTPKFVNLVVGIMIGATFGEYFLLLYQAETILSLFTLLQLFIRLVSLFFMRSYALSLSSRIISEEEAKKRVEETARNLEKTSQELKETNLKLQEMANLKDEFVSVASHELRAPMTTIKGYLSMILEGDAGKITPKVKEFLKNAYESNDRMIRLVNNMLNVSRIESGRLIVNLKDIQLEEIIESVVNDFQLEAKQHGLKLVYKRPDKKLPKVRVDPDRIREIISNLVNNAIKFTVKGSVTLKNKLDQKQLFKKFSQIAGRQQEVGKGSGLGLYICRMLLAEFGGKIWLKSKVGQGTTFYFSLPLINLGD